LGLVLTGIGCARVAPDECHASPRAAVQVSVLDDVAASPNRPDGPVRASHGARVAELVREGACAPEEPCSVRVVAVSAMPRFDDPGRLAEGPGRFGTRADLARAVDAAVDAWTGESSDTRPVHLILNISAGWDPSTGCLGGDLPADVREVLRSLERAYCHGVLVFAATGNQRFPELEGPGPLCPAAWETLPGPSAAECRDRHGAASGRYADDRRPLVTAISGVMAGNAVIPEARRASLAALVAVAEVEADAGLPTRGTSFATARAAGVAAALWARQPAWSGAELLHALYASGTALEMESEFGPDSPRTVRRVDRAAALLSACP
jgi:subtilisin family serine protease